MGALNSCCCGPKSDGYRTIWTERPWGFYHQFDVAIFATRPKLPVYNGGSGAVVGYQSDGGFWQRQQWEDPKYYFDETPTEENRAWNGTRYLCQVTRNKWVGHAGPIYDYNHEWWEWSFYDPNTGEEFTAISGSVGPAPPGGGEPYFGHVDSYEETLTETAAKLVRTFSGDWFGEPVNGTIEQEWLLYEPVTWGDQTNRAKSHLDYIFNTMTESTLKGALPIVHDGGTHSWVYATYSGVSAHIAAGRIKVSPKSGTFSATLGAYTFTEWTPGTDQTLATGNVLSPRYSTQPYNLPVVYGVINYPSQGLHWTSDDSGIAYTGADEYATPAGDFGQTIVLQYTCHRVKQPWNCDPYSRSTRFNEVFTASPESRPAWGQVLACTSPLVSLPTGWYAFDTTGVKLASVPGGSPYTFPIPSSDYFTIEIAGVCCPP